MLRLALVGEYDRTRYSLLEGRLRGATLDPLDVDDIAQHPDLAGIVIDAPLDARVDLCQRLVTTGKPILVPMPLARTQDVADQVLDACGAAHIRVMPSNRVRFLPSVKAMRDALDADQLGKPGLLRIHRWRTDDDPNALVQELDLACWMFGSAPETVFAVNASGIAAEQIHLGFPGGGMALIDIARIDNGNDYTSRTLIGSTGAAYADDHHNTQLLFRDGGTHPVRTGQGIADLLAEIQTFADFVSSESDPPISVEDARLAHLVASKVEESLRSKSSARCAGNPKS